MPKYLEKLVALVVFLLAVWLASKAFPRLPLSHAALMVGMVRAGIAGVRKIRRDEAQWLRTTDISRLSPLDYERFCALRLRDSGWQAYTTPRQDQGVDVIATLRGMRVAIQCKKYAKPVGNRAVQEIVAGQRHYRAHIGAVVSNAPYTNSARALAASNHVLLLHHDHLPRLEQLAKVPFEPR